MRRALLLVLTLGLLGCPRVVRQQKVEQQLEAGVPVPFSAESDRSWDFGDGSPRQTGREVRHAFGRAGHYVVQAFDGEHLTDAWDLFVVPRSVFHAVSPDAEAAIVARSLDELGPAVDFSERLGGAATTQRWLEALPVLGFALQQGAGGTSVVDGGEGLGVFTWPDSDVVVGFVGVTAEVKALEVFDAWLRTNGWEPLEEAEPRRYAHGSVYLAVFTDRGILYALSRTEEEPPISAAIRIAKASSHGLEASPPIAAELNELPSGGLVIFSRPGSAMPWTAVTAALRFSGDEARLIGRLWAREPLWKTPPMPADRLLQRVAEGVVAAASVSVPAERVASALVGTPKSARRARAGQAAKAAGFDLDALVGALAGQADAAAWLDTVGFLKSVVENQGRPEPRGTLLVDAKVRAMRPVEQVVDAELQRSGLPSSREKSSGLVRWRTRLYAQDVELALTPQAATLTAGTRQHRETTVDLAKQLGARFEGAFGPGHVSLFIDVGQVRREMMIPRSIEGVDPVKLISAQALTMTFIDQLTQLDELLFDVAPDARGASVQAVARLRPRPKVESQ